MKTNASACQLKLHIILSAEVIYSHKFQETKRIGKRTTLSKTLVK